MRLIRRFDLVSAAAIALAVVLASIPIAFVVAALARTTTPGPVAAAVAFLAIAGSGLLYASRLGAGGLDD